MAGWAGWAALALLTVVLHVLVRSVSQATARSRLVIPARRTPCAECGRPHGEPAWLRTPLACRGPAFVFKLDLVYLAVVLVALPAMWANEVGHLPRHLGNPVAGIVPVGVLMAGALGGITISLYGVFQHNDRWRSSLNFWHVARPFMGALLGSIGFVLYVATIQATGSNVELSRTQATGEKLLFYYVIAFVVGYREETFRELIKRAADLILKPESLAVRASVVATPATGPAPLDVTFDASGSVNVSRWNIDYGDGTEAVECTGTPSMVRHTYDKPGRYIATVSVANESGQKAVQSTQVLVGEGASVGAGAPAQAGAAGAPGAQGSAATTGNGGPAPGAVPTPVLQDAGVDRLLAATSDEERRQIERELIENTDKFVEEVADSDADDA